MQRHPTRCIITPDGVITQLLDENLVSNGVAGYNSEIVNVCYIGGVDPNNVPHDTRTIAQKNSLLTLLKRLKKKYSGAIIQGHHDFPGVAKACPSFNAKQEYSSL